MSARNENLLILGLQVSLHFLVTFYALYFSTCNKQVCNYFFAFDEISLQSYVRTFYYLDFKILDF